VGLAALCAASKDACGFSEQRSWNRCTGMGGGAGGARRRPRYFLSFDELAEGKGWGAGRGAWCRV